MHSFQTLSSACSQPLPGQQQIPSSFVCERSQKQLRTCFESIERLPERDKFHCGCSSLCGLEIKFRFNVGCTQTMSYQQRWNSCIKLPAIHEGTLLPVSAEGFEYGICLWLDGQIRIWHHFLFHQETSHAFCLKFGCSLFLHGR